MSQYEYMILYMGKNGLGRVTMTLDRPITDVDTIMKIDETLREQEDGEGNKDETIFVLNYKLLKSYNV